MKQNQPTEEAMRQFSDYLAGIMGQEEEEQFLQTMSEEAELQAAFQDFKDTAEEAAELKKKNPGHFSSVRQKLEAEGFFSGSPAIVNVEQPMGQWPVAMRYLVVATGLLLLALAAFWAGRQTAPVSKTEGGAAPLTDTVYVEKMVIYKDTMVVVKDPPPVAIGGAGTKKTTAALDSIWLETKDFIGSASGSDCSKWVVLLKDKKDYPGALKALSRECVKSAPENYAAGALHFHQLDKGGSLDEAIRYFAEALEQYGYERRIPNNLLQWLMEAYQKKGDKAAAAELQKIISSSSNQ